MHRLLPAALLMLGAAFPGEADPPSLEGDTRFYRELLQKARCTNEDGARIVLIFAEKADWAKPDERMTRATNMGFLEEKWETKAEETLPADLFAYMLCQALKLKGGVTARLLGMSPRTAYRECVSLRLMRAGGQGRGLAGREVLSIMARADEYRKKREEKK